MPLIVNGMKEHLPENEKKAFGYGGISDCEAYLKQVYGVDAVLQKEVLLPDEADSNLQISGRKDAENCSVAAAARVCEYWCSRMQIKFAHNLMDSYQVAEILAATKYHYTPKKGLSQFRIKPLLHETTHRYGINLDCRLRIFWNYKTHIQAELDAGRPVILNIAIGYYHNHSITVCGYRVYEGGGQVYTMLCTADGWHAGLRYIDLRAFRRFPGFQGISSVNTAELAELD